MNILFDFITFQDKGINGGNYVTFMILKEMISLGHTMTGVAIGRREFPEEVNRIINDNNIKVLDFNIKSLNGFIESNKIEQFFIGIAQRFNKYDLTGLTCKIVILCHDLVDLSMLYARQCIPRFLLKKTNPLKFISYNVLISILPVVIKKYKNKFYKNFEKLIKKTNVYVVTVSEYSKYSLEYFFNDIANEIRIFYPLGKIEKKDINQANITLKIDKPFFVLTGCDRHNKNCGLFLEVWDKFYSCVNKQFNAVIIGGVKVCKPGVVSVSYLNDDEYEWICQNAYAFIYPSLGEGFGLPPLEFMKYGVPCLCSCATSIPEVYGDSCIYFNPLYPEDLFMKMILLQTVWKEYSEKASDKFIKLADKNKEDLKLFVSYLESM